MSQAAEGSPGPSVGWKGEEGVQVHGEPGVQGRPGGRAVGVGGPGLTYLSSAPPLPVT